MQYGNQNTGILLQNRRKSMIANGGSDRDTDRHTVDQEVVGSIPTPSITAFSSLFSMAACRSQTIIKSVKIFLENLKYIFTPLYLTMIAVDPTVKNYGYHHFINHQTRSNVMGQGCNDKDQLPPQLGIKFQQDTKYLESIGVLPSFIEKFTRFAEQLQIPPMQLYNNLQPIIFDIYNRNYDAKIIQESEESECCWPGCNKVPTIGIHCDEHEKAELRAR